MIVSNKNFQSRIVYSSSQDSTIQSVINRDLDLDQGVDFDWGNSRWPPKLQANTHYSAFVDLLGLRSERILVKSKIYPDTYIVFRGYRKENLVMLHELWMLKCRPTPLPRRTKVPSFYWSSTSCFNLAQKRWMNALLLVSISS